MTGNEIRLRYLEFMSKNGHAIIPSSPLVPENDPTTLFTGSGMQPLIPYLMGETHPMGRRLVNSQKCFRANDIEEVGDNRHTTFFEMLGNWSLGDYFKHEQLRWFFTFLVDEIGLDPTRIYVTVFAGDETLGIEKDTVSVEIWKELFAERGIEAKDIYIGSEENGYEIGMQDGRIFYYDAGKNWWSRSGTPHKMPPGEIGGPDSEVFYDFGPEFATDPRYKNLAAHPNSDSGQFVEIGNSVFIEYIKNTDGTFSKLPQRNVDFGGGLERIAAAKNQNPDVFLVDLLHTVIQRIEILSQTAYSSNEYAYRIITDHLRGAVFLIGDGVLPNNADQGYFVRRLIRRAVRYADIVGVPEGQFSQLAQAVIDAYATHYPNLTQQESLITSAIAREEEQFRLTLSKGLKEFDRLAKDTVTAEVAFTLFTTYGFPLELTEELAIERGISVDTTGFKKLMEEHKEKSRLGSEQKFKGGLADNSEIVVQYHTCTHLMLAGLRKILGDHVHQAGSNITAERMRYDITHPEKISDDQLRQVEHFVNEALSIGGKVSVSTMSKEDAQNDSTIEASFWDRYPDEVKVYTITASNGTIISKELCGGPHVEKLEVITKQFYITKEESSSAGIRRIKAILK
jgi:alanyl-tRNA synthetase